MSKVDLASRGWCDLVFEGRNKDYGAYKMRARSGSRNLRAIIGLLILIAGIGVIVLFKAGWEALEGGNKVEEDKSLELQQLQKEEPKKKEEKKIEVEYEKPEIQKVQVKASIQFDVPKIEDDNLVDETKQVKSQDQVTKSNISIAAQDYAGDGKGGINIDDLKDNQRAGGTEAPKEEEVLANEIVEVQAQFPGGERALRKYVSDNLVYPSIAQEQELQGVVTLRFRVEKDGSVGKIVVVKGLSRECDEAAVKVVSSLPRFTPARQQGHPVPVWFTLPVRFRLI